LDGEPYVSRGIWETVKVHKGAVPPLFSIWYHLKDWIVSSLREEEQDNIDFCRAFYSPERVLYSVLKSFPYSRLDEEPRVFCEEV
jgi:hypothetical protein